MKAIKCIALLCALLLAGGSAWAHGPYGSHGRVHFGVVIGAPWGWYYPPPYYYPPAYYPPVIVTQPEPQVYIEKNQQAEAAASNVWYYCRDAKAYYPYVKDCPAGWEKVAPQPQP